MHIVLDLETMGNGPRAPIVSIGAVHVDAAEMRVDVPVWYGVIDLASAVERGGQMDASTVMWWLQQGDQARGALSKNAVALECALQSLRTWMLKWGNYSELRVWGYGADFDCTILASAYKSVGMDVPWSYRNVRCLRTLKAVLSDRIPNVQHVLTKHNALDDAEHQANILLQCAKALGGLK